MGKRRIPVDDYLNALIHMRQGASNRLIAEAGIISKNKLKDLREAAELNGWLDPTRPQPDLVTLTRAFSSSAALCFRGLSTSKPGEVARIDCNRGPNIINSQTKGEYPTWIFLMELKWSGLIYAECITNQKILTWLACHQNAFGFFKGIPARIEIVPSRTRILDKCFRDPLIAKPYQEFASEYGFGYKVEAAECGEHHRLKSKSTSLRQYQRQHQDFCLLSDINAATQGFIANVNSHRNPVSAMDRFSFEEVSTLKPLPYSPPALVVRAEAIVQGNGHIQYEKNEYSVPHEFIGKTVEVLVHQTVIQIFHRRIILATHQHLSGVGQRSTRKQDLLVNKDAYNLSHVRYRLSQASEIGSACRELVDRLFSRDVLRNYKSVQGILRLAEKYGAQRLEVACKEAIARNTLTYKEVKNILGRNEISPSLKIGSGR